MKRIVAGICNILGIGSMLLVIALTVPFILPRLWGWQPYGVLTGSMEPAYGVNSLVYVEACEWDSLQVGDVITYGLESGASHVMTHRILEIGEDSLVTKGDANEEADPIPISRERIIGRVKASIPGIYPLGAFLQSKEGKWGIGILFLVAGGLWIGADALTNDRTKNPNQNPNQDKKANQDKKTDQDRKPARVKTGKWQYNVLIALGLMLMVGALAYMVFVVRGYARGRQIYHRLEERVLGNANTASGRYSTAGASEEWREQGEHWKNQGDDWQEQTNSWQEQAEHIGRVLSEMSEENEDLVGWISFESLDIQYPIMQGEDDEEYLYHTFSGEYNRGGSIFMEAQNTGDWNDFHTIVYGHNMRNGSMFGRLKELGKKENYEDRRFFTIYTPKAVYRYEIFAMYDIEAGGDIYNISPATVEERGALIANMQKRSYIQTGVPVGTGDRIVTLSTCSVTGRRFVVNARCVEIKSL